MTDLVSIQQNLFFFFFKYLPFYYLKTDSFMLPPFANSSLGSRSYKKTKRRWKYFQRAALTWHETSRVAQTSTLCLLPPGKRDFTIKCQSTECLIPLCPQDEIVTIRQGHICRKSECFFYVLEDKKQWKVAAACCCRHQTGDLRRQFASNTADFDA